MRNGPPATPLMCRRLVQAVRVSDIGLSPPRFVDGDRLFGIARSSLARMNYQTNLSIVLGVPRGARPQDCGAIASGRQDHVA